MSDGFKTASLEELEEELKNVMDPEIGINIVDLGLIYDMNYNTDGTLFITMTLTSAACPLQPMIEEQVETIVSALVDSYRINWVWMPPWDPGRITEDGKDQMRSIGFNI